MERPNKVFSIVDYSQINSSQLTAKPRYFLNTEKGIENLVDCIIENLPLKKALSEFVDFSDLKKHLIDLVSHDQIADVNVLIGGKFRTIEEFNLEEY